MEIFPRNPDDQLSLEQYHPSEEKPQTSELITPHASLEENQTTQVAESIELMGQAKLKLFGKSNVATNANRGAQVITPDANYAVGQQRFPG